MLLWLLGCVAFPDGLAYQALDYRLDRPRVLAIRFDPPVLRHGVPVEIDALALGPGRLESVRMDVCGLRDDVPVQADDPNCFRNPDLVAPVAASLPGTWEPPDLSGLDCGDTGLGECWSEVPFLVTAVIGGREAYGMLRGRVGEPPTEIPPSVNDAARALVVEGEPRAGGEVELVFTVESEVDWWGVRWYVDDGELVGTGRTASWPLDGGGRTSRNTLRIPAAFHGPLRIAAVIAGPLVAPGDMAWEVVTIEVPP